MKNSMMIAVVAALAVGLIGYIVGPRQINKAPSSQSTVKTPVK